MTRCCNVPGVAQPGSAAQICRDDKATPRVGARSGRAPKVQVANSSIDALRALSYPTASGAAVGAIVETKLAMALIVGWSNSTVCGSSASTRCASVVARAVAAIESRPADISGVSAATDVPAVSRTTVDTMSMMTGTSDVILRDRLASALGTGASDASNSGVALGDTSSS